MLFDLHLVKTKSLVAGSDTALAGASMILSALRKVVDLQSSSEDVFVNNFACVGRSSDMSSRFLGAGWRVRSSSTSKSRVRQDPKPFSTSLMP